LALTPITERNRLADGSPRADPPNCSEECDRIPWAQANLPEGEVGEAYDGGLTGSGGTPPYTWSIVPPDALPPGLSLNTSTGAISGTPTTSGTYSFTAGLIDSNEFGAASAPSESITISSG
jgi:hypothetical protein